MDSIEWPTSLYKRWGADSRLCGIRVYHDFQWTDIFPDERTQFKNGRRLAELVKQSCPKGKIPALLLTRRTDVTTNRLLTDECYIAVINIDEYLKIAYGDAAKTYFANLMPADIITAANICWSELSDDEQRTLLGDHLDINLLRAWINDNPARLDIVTAILKEFEINPKTLINDLKKKIATIIKIMGNDFWTAIQEAGTELPDVLAHRKLWAIRKTRVDEFRTHLQTGDWQETDWQRFFEHNTWIFGYGLLYQFLHQIEGRPSLGGKDLTGKGSQEGDYLLATAAMTKFTVLVEIKKPNADLVTNKAYRNRVYELGPDLTGGVTQLQQQCRRWDIYASGSAENRDLLESQEIFTHEPRGILVIGDTNTIKGNRDKRSTFESFRRNIHNPEIITFDELFYRAEQAVKAYAEDAEL